MKTSNKRFTKSEDKRVFSMVVAAIYTPLALLSAAALAL